MPLERNTPGSWYKPRRPPVHPCGRGIRVPPPGAGLGTDPAEKQLLYQLPYKELRRYDAGQCGGWTRDGGWVIPAKVIRAQLHLAAALPNVTRQGL